MKIIICGTILYNSFPHSLVTKCYSTIKVNKQEIVKGNDAMKLVSKDFRGTMNIAQLEDRPRYR